MTRLMLLAISFLLSACVSNPPVQLASTSSSIFDGAVYGGDIAEISKPVAEADIYRASYQGGSGFVSLNSVRATVEGMAARHCARQGGLARPLRETASKAPYVLGNFPRVEWLFQCVSQASRGSNAGDSDKLTPLERLKKLLDSGALTAQEYEREKAKILD